MLLLATYIQQAKKTYTDTRTRRNIHNINYELQDVQRIMVQNIDDVLQRGQALSGEWFVWCVDPCGYCILIQWLFVLYTSIPFRVNSVFIVFLDLDSKASDLSMMSKKYRSDAHTLNLRSSAAKLAAIVVVIVILLLLLRYLVF